MDYKIKIIPVLFLVIGLSVIPAYADVPSPLQQFNQGTSLVHIQCGDSKVLLAFPTGKPACVNEHNVEKLQDRGFILITNTELVKTSDGEQRPPLRRGPADIPILIKYSGSSAEEITQTIQELQTAKQLHRESTTRSSNSSFNVADWTPDYIPKGYKLGYAVHSSHVYDSDKTIRGLSMQFVPDLFIYTNSTIDPDIEKIGGIFYLVHSHNDKNKYLSYENHHAALSNLSIGYSDFIKSELIVNQTNGYFGIKKPDNEHAGFYADIAFDEYFVNLRYIGQLSYDEGIKIINSIQGQVLPDE